MHYVLVSHGKEPVMSDPKTYRSMDEWYSLIQEARKSGMTDAQWCLANGISRHTFNNAIRRLRKNAYAIPSRSRDIKDLTASKQEVVKVDIVPDVRLPEVKEPVAAPYLDNSHMMEITFGDVHISINNGADPVLVSKTISILRSYS